MSEARKLEGAYLVTGGAGAIAKPIVMRLAAAGARVVVVDLDQGRAGARAAEVGGLGVAADLTSATGAAAMVRAAEKAYGPVAGLVHTTGGFAMGPLGAATDADYDRMFDLNVRTLFYAVRAVLPSMKDAKRGFICGFSSEPGLTGAAPNSALYGAAKSAVATLLHSLDRELDGSVGDIRVAVMYPMGAVDTPANRRDMPAFDPTGYIDPDDIATTIVHAASTSARGRLVDLAVYPRRRSAT